LVLCVSLRASRRGRVEACAKMREDGGCGLWVRDATDD